MNKRDIVIGIIIILLVGAGVYFLRTRKTSIKVTEPTKEEKIEQIEEKFKVELPEDLEKAELKAVSGQTGLGVATRKFENNQFTLTILADLANPITSQFYQAWLVKGASGDPDYDLVSAGKMTVAKGGFITEFQSKTDLSDHKKILVTLEKVADQKPETSILEGSF